MWDDQFETFAESYQVIRYDQRGFGQSAVPTGEPFRPIDDLKALLEHLSITQAHILGMSMGGTVAIDFVLAYPAMARTLIVVDGDPSGFDLPEIGVWWDAYIADARANGPKVANKNILSIPVLRADMAIPHVARRVEQMHLDYSCWYVLNEDPRYGLEPPALQQLDQINVPTLIVVGEDDYHGFQEAANFMLEKIPQAQKVVIPRAGHFSNMCEPQQFNAAVLDFLSLSD
jgi:pimeloyl-ACP methyl ester carboxylesterase